MLWNLWWLLDFLDPGSCPSYVRYVASVVRDVLFCVALFVSKGSTRWSSGSICPHLEVESSRNWQTISVDQRFCLFGPFFGQPLFSRDQGCCWACVIHVGSTPLGGHRNRLPPWSSQWIGRNVVFLSWVLMGLSFGQDTQSVLNIGNILSFSL